MKVIGRIVGVVIRALALASIAGAIGAVAMKRKFEPVDAPDADEIRVATFFGPLAYESRSTAFRGGTLECWYGGGIVDLRGATLDPAGATLNVKAIFGGAQILVPETWQVTTRVAGIGGVGDTRPAIERDATAPQLTIQGLAVFGGFGVASEVPDEAMEGLRSAVARRKGAAGGDVAAAPTSPEPIPA